MGAQGEELLPAGQDDLLEILGGPIDDALRDMFRELGSEEEEERERSLNERYGLKLATADTLSSVEGLSEFGRVAVVQSIFQAVPKERTEYARRFKHALEELDGRMSEDQVVFYIYNNESGFYRVVESGITAKIKNFTRGQRPIDTLPRAIVMSKQVQGVKSPYGTDYGNRVLRQIYDVDQDNLMLYGVELQDNLHAQPLEILETSLIGGPLERTANPGFRVGETQALAVLEDINVFQLSDAVEMAIVACRLGLKPDINERFSSSSREHLRDQLIKTMGAQVMNAVLQDPTVSIIFRTRPGSDQEMIDAEIAQADGSILGPLAEILGLEREETKNLIKEQIDALEKAIDEGEVHAHRWPEVAVGRRRLEIYLSDIWPRTR